MAKSLAVVVRVAARAIVSGLALIVAAAASACGGDGMMWPPDAGSADGAPADGRPAIDGGVPDGGGDGGASDAGPEGGPRGRVLYGTDRTLSPITPDIAAHLREIRARGPGLHDDVFAKVGASATESPAFMHCFATGPIDLGGRDALAPALDWYTMGDAAGTTPFDRDSLTAVSGWHAGRALEGEPPPLTQELDAIRPGSGVVMYGTNDINIVSVYAYARNMMRLTDRMLERGVIPLLTSIMPRADDPEASAQVPLYNLVVRGIAQGRQVPLIDFHRELVVLPDLGLSDDGVHPSVYWRDGAARPCLLTPTGLEHGYNIRNLITLQTLDRVRRAVVARAPSPDRRVPRIRGDGTARSPYTVEGLPFTDLRDTTTDGQRRLDVYGGCAADQDESGPEVLYRLELSERTALEAYVLDRTSADIDVHLLDESASEAGCLDRAHRELRATVSAGTYYLALDTFVSSGEELAGEYVLVVRGGPV